MNSTTKYLTTAGQLSELDREAFQRIVDRRLALRLGLTLPVAAVAAALNGLGPTRGRRA